jgi:methylthioribose-1-phosphate isomerase
MNRTIDWDGQAIVIIDQTLLPGEERLLRLRDVPTLAEAIQSLRIRGAPALGVAGALGIALAVRQAQERGTDLQVGADRAAAVLAATRPTAVNLHWGIEQARQALAAGPQAVVERAMAILEADVQTNRKIAERGADWLDTLRARQQRRLRILTHCNTGALACVEMGTALGVIQVSYSRGAVEDVLATETRPLLQGARLTAWELQRLRIPFRLVADAAAPSLIARGMVDVAVVGADRIAANGDVANKVGTYPLALAARRAGVPFVVVAPETTVDPAMPSGQQIPIEERPEEEVLGFGSLRIAPAEARALNPAFDVTPAELISAIVTEDRVIEPAVPTQGAAAPASIHG